jgi:hypothetical protein
MLEPRPRDVGDAAPVRPSVARPAGAHRQGEAEMSTNHERIAGGTAEHLLGTGRALSSPLLSKTSFRAAAQS